MVLMQEKALLTPGEGQEAASVAISKQGVNNKRTPATKTVIEDSAPYRFIRTG